MNENTPLYVSYLRNLREFMNGLLCNTYVIVVRTMAPSTKIERGGGGGSFLVNREIKQQDGFRKDRWVKGKDTLQEGLKLVQ